MSTLRRSKKRGRYSRNTQGWNAQGFFSPTTPNAYATQATLQGFIYSEASGTIGIYDETGARQTALLAAGDKVRIVQKNSDDTIKRSTTIEASNIKVTKTGYDAPVIQKDLVGYNGTSGDLNISIVGGLQEFVLSVREQTPANQPFPVMEGRAVVRGGSPTDYQIVSQIISDLSNSYDFERNADNAFAAVYAVTDQAGTTQTLGTDYVFTAGSTQVFVAGADVTAEAVAGNYLILKNVSPSKLYQIVSSSYDGTNTTIVLDNPYSTSTEGGVDTIVIANLANEVEATIAAGALGIAVEGIDELVHFETSVSEDLGDADITNSVDWNFGSGAAFQVAAIEDESAVFDGWTTVNEAFVTDYGAPDLFVDDTSSDQYALYFIEALNSIIPSAGAPQNQTLQKAYFIVAAIEGSDLETNLDTIFGT